MNHFMKSSLTNGAGQRSNANAKVTSGRSQGRRGYERAAMQRTDADLTPAERLREIAAIRAGGILCKRNRTLQGFPCEPRRGASYLRPGCPLPQEPNGENAMLPYTTAVHLPLGQIRDATRRFWLDISCAHHSMRHRVAVHRRCGRPVTAAGDVGMRRPAGASE